MFYTFSAPASNFVSFCQLFFIPRSPSLLLLHPFPPSPLHFSLQISSIIYAVFSFCQLKQSFIDSKRGRCEAKTLPALWGFVSSYGSIRSRGEEGAHTHSHRCEQYEATLLLWFIKQKRKRFPIETTFRVQVFKNSSFTRVQHLSLPAPLTACVWECVFVLVYVCVRVCASNKKMYCRKSIKMHFVFAFYGLKISFTASWVHVCAYVCACVCVFN